MAQRRRKFSPQFKVEAVQFVIEFDRPVAQVARELEIHEGTLGSWVQAWRQANPNLKKGGHRWNVSVWPTWRTRSAGCGWKTSS